MKLLVLTTASAADEVLPGLALLAHHTATVATPSMAHFLTHAADADVVLVDGRHQPRNACQLAGSVVAGRPGLPTIGVVGTETAPDVGEDCAIVQLIMATAGPAEIDARLRLAARPAPAGPGRTAGRWTGAGSDATAAPAPGPGGVLTVGDLVMDVASWSARVEERPLRLARREFELLGELAMHAGRPLSRRHLLSRVWGSDYDGSARTVDVHVRQLRHALGAHHRDMIRTVRGTGYVLVRTAAREEPVAYDPVERVATPHREQDAVRGPLRPARRGGRDAPSDVVAAKRAGLPLDLARLADGGTLGALERYSLKTLGVCSQAQDDRYMVRARTRSVLTSDTARALADIARSSGHRRLHLTTRQQVEMHHVRGNEVPAVLERMRTAGLDPSSTCGHTVRGVTSCPDGGVSLDEPFDCTPDAQLVTGSLLALCPDLNTRMPQRFNIAFGGCPSCRDHAKVSDVGFVSVLGPDGAPGYELWVGGSLGKSAPALATRVVDFVPRHRVLPAVHAVLEVFLGHGEFDKPGRARLKFLVARVGIERFVDLLAEAYAESRTRDWPAPPPLATIPAPSLSDVLAHAPEGGWGAGVRPQRTAGLATVTVTVPLGDLDADDLAVLAEVADGYGDGRLRLGRDQNVVVRDVPVARVTALRAELATAGLQVHSQLPSRDVRACTGGPVCALALTPAQRLGHQLWRLPALVRNTGVRVSVSGCPSSCAQHQVADIGLAGNWVTIAGERVLGYRVYLGGDLRHDRLGQVLGRIAETDVEAVTTSVVETWERERTVGESLGATVARRGLDPFVFALGDRSDVRWAIGDEAGNDDVPVGQVTAAGATPGASR